MFNDISSKWKEKPSYPLQIPSVWEMILTTVLSISVMAERFSDQIEHSPGQIRGLTRGMCVQVADRHNEPS